MAFIAMPSDVSGKITINSQKTTTNRLLIAQYGNGYGQYANDGLNSNIDKWNIEIAPIDASIKASWEAFYAAVGNIYVFTWTPPGETLVKKWRIDKDSVKLKLISTTKYAINMSITQQFDVG